MLAVRHNLHSSGVTRRTRDAFTLVEILVVMAILVIIASIGTIGLLRYLENARESNARMNAQNIQKAAKSYYAMNDSNWPPSLSYLIGGDGGRPLIEGGERAITDPWGKPFQFEVVQDQLGTGEEIPVVFTTNPQGKRIAWPREYGDI